MPPPACPSPRRVSPGVSQEAQGSRRRWVTSVKLRRTAAASAGVSSTCGDTGKGSPPQPPPSPSCGVRSPPPHTHLHGAQAGPPKTGAGAAGHHGRHRVQHDGQGPCQPLLTLRDGMGGSGGVGDPPRPSTPPPHTPLEPTSCRRHSSSRMGWTRVRRPVASAGRLLSSVWSRWASSSRRAAGEGGHHSGRGGTTQPGTPPAPPLRQRTGIVNLEGILVAEEEEEQEGLGGTVPPRDAGSVPHGVGGIGGHQLWGDKMGCWGGVLLLAGPPLPSLDPPTHTPSSPSGRSQGAVVKPNRSQSASQEGSWKNRGGGGVAGSPTGS